MRLILISILGVLGLVLFVPALSQAETGIVLPTAVATQLAQDNFGFSVPAGTGDIRTKEDVVRVVNRAINILFGFLLLLAVVFLLIAAYYFLFAGDDSGKIETAKTMIRYTVIAILIGGLSRAIVSLTLYLIEL